ncbi:hypothetical protein CHLNCDRAFT_143598 [Chlorella variabilis]|uniref:Protein PAM68, chloroplastic n=1 Tax=Chlorella variabilis TaxID=554065 RepID=E1ZA27_CHLVA|nr:hypothetical protein CHLNCDRAFT_143598 [Chlorella variabilis]EFN56986.1 hypothetical protein CHLNCDRAFT_143598 [Chlorella variabilis]|eukprot:XP_005849088.1 hypothetical protein CHLNCDRAFT_143598 [Chlorella variabilis]
MALKACTAGICVPKSKRGKVASRPSPKLTLEQLQAEQAAYESQRQQQQQPPTAAAASSEEEEEGEELYYGGSSSGGAGGAGGRAGGTVQYGSSDAVPEVVTNRMLRRVILFMGTPVFGGILLFPFFYWLKIKQGVDLPNWVAYLSSSLTFGGGLLGISYGIMSASWDPRREGSLLGWTEFQANVPLLLDRFKRGSD